MILPILCFNWLLTQQGQSQAQLPFPHKILPKDHAWKYKAHIMDSRPTRRPTAENKRELLPATSSTLHQDCLSNLMLISVYISTAKDKQFRVLLLYLIQAKQPRPTLLLYLDVDELLKTTSALGPRPAQTPGWQAFHGLIRFWSYFNRRFLSGRIPLEPDSRWMSDHYTQGQTEL